MDVDDSNIRYIFPLSGSWSYIRVVVQKNILEDCNIFSILLIWP